MPLASERGMLSKRAVTLVLALVIPCAIAGAAFFAASGIGSLVEATLSEASVAVAARAVPPPIATAVPRPSAEAILDRNPFDHVTGSLRPVDPPSGVVSFSGALAETPACDGVRPLVIVATSDPDMSFAAFEVGDKRVLRKRKDEIAGMRIALIAHDRVIFERPGSHYCQARLFGPRAERSAESRGGPSVESRGAGPSAFEREIASKIVKRSDTEFEIDRATVDRILEAQAELMKSRIVPEKRGDRAIGVRILAVKSGSVLSLIGIRSGDVLETINGFSIATPEESLQAYARLRAGADHLVVHLTRDGKPVNIDYSIR